MVRVQPPLIQWSVCPRLYAGQVAMFTEGGEPLIEARINGEAVPNDLAPRTDPVVELGSDKGFHHRVRIASQARYLLPLGCRQD